VLIPRKRCGKITLKSIKLKGGHMDTRFYQAPDLDIERIARDLDDYYLSQDYQVQHFGNKERMVVQVKMGSQLEAVFGMQAALTVTLEHFPRGVLATVGQQQWLDKAAAWAIGMLLLWPLAITAGVGAIRQVSLESQVFDVLDTVVFRQRPDAKVGSVPPDLEAQARQQASSSSYENVAPRQGSQQFSTQALKCFHCGEPYDAGDIYCSRCGKPLASPKKHCPVCKSEVKSDATFCTKCGAALTRV
jgi:predicted nucleic acid-binding Zn ribbon protein